MSIASFSPTGPRAVAVIIKDDQLLLMRRIKGKRDYFIFGGGTIEEGETNEEGLLREITEEFSLQATKPHFLFQFVNGTRTEYWFLVRNFSGTAVLGGPEKMRQTEANQYIPTWVSLASIPAITNLYPYSAKMMLLDWLKKNDL